MGQSLLDLKKLYRFVQARVSSTEMDPCLSLLYCIVRNINEKDCAESDKVLIAHNSLTSQRITRITDSKEYRELFSEGFIYAVRINGGKTSALKFQRFYAEGLKADNYHQLLDALNQAPAIQRLQSRPQVVMGQRRKLTPIQKLQSRINREIKRKTYLSDILIDEDEYDLLKTELKKTILYARRTKRLSESPLFAVAVVQVALRVYQDGNFWGRFFSELELSKGDGAEQRIIGTAFYKVLKDYERVSVNPNQYKLNILLHCYVADPYLDSYFSFLYAVYTSLLDRDLSQLDREAMNALIERADRSELLVINTAEAFKANPRGAKIRIRNHLKLLDKLFWDSDYTLQTAHRIYTKLQIWARHSDKLILESASGRLNATRGKKRFSRPYLFFDKLQFGFKLVLPQQVVIGDDADLHWSISGQIDKVIIPEIVEAVVGYRVQECSLRLDSWQDLLGDFRIKLMDHNENVIRSFSLPKADVRFFDEDGYLVFTNSLHEGLVFSLAQKGTELHSSCLSESHEYQGMVLSAFQFERDDILILPNGHAVSIGAETITSGLTGNSVVSNTQCLLQNGETLKLLNKLPHIIIRTTDVKAPGTCIEINGERYSLTDVASMRFPIDDRSGDTGYWIELDKTVMPHNGVWVINADIPGGATYTWKFVLVQGFEASFDGAPYIFEPRGVVRFNENLKVTALEESCQKASEDNAFTFELAKVGRAIDFGYQNDGFECTISVDVPALFTSFNGDDWSAERPETIWHADLPDVIFISAPQSSITLYTDDRGDDSSSSAREQDYRKAANESFITCDIRWSKSHLDGGANISVLNIKTGEETTVLLQVVRHSIPMTCSIMQADNGNAIRVHASILGKGSYFADLYREGQQLEGKKPLEDGSCTFNLLVENGQYAVALFELEDDESGFEEKNYHALGKYYSEVVNPYDMSRRAFQILYVEGGDQANKMLDLSFDYFVENLKRADETGTYTGMMVIEAGSSKLAAFPVRVVFQDLNDPSTVAISFEDEYGDMTSFLYDTRRKALLKEENPMLSKLTCYRRYTFLDPDQDLFRIELVDRRDSDCRNLPFDLKLEESTPGFTFRTAVTRIANRKPATRDVTWNRAAYPYVMQTHISNIAEFSNWTKKGMQKRYNMPDKVIDSIETTLAFFGVFFHRDTPNQDNT
jgi:hypothetical protein